MFGVIYINQISDLDPLSLENATHLIVNNCYYDISTIELALNKRGYMVSGAAEKLSAWNSGTKYPIAKISSIVIETPLDTEEMCPICLLALTTEPQCVRYFQCTTIYHASCIKAWTACVRARPMSLSRLPLSKSCPCPICYEQR